MTGDPFDFDGLTVPCTLGRQLTVLAGTLAACAGLGVLVASVAWRTLIERRVP